MTDEPGTEPAFRQTGPDSRWRRWSWILWAAGGGAIIVALVGVLALGGAPDAGAAPVAPGIGSASATLLQLDVLTGTKLTAPDFSLTDQNGKALTLAQFRGRSVVLTFNDDQCEDLCTLLAQDVAAANRDLGRGAGKIAFLSINVNPYAPHVDAVKSWTDKHGLGRAANWWFGTGTAKQLSAVSQAYGVPVELDPVARTVTHGAEIFFINPAGRESALGQFGTESANTAPFAHTMAQMAVDLLPTAQRSPVAGPSVVPPAPGGTEIGDTPAPIVLPQLGEPSTTVSSAAARGKFQILNFWASTCTACVQEMPGLETANNALHGKVAFLGIDVSDAAAASAFARRSGTTYPLVSDRDGTAAGRFQISGLPYTVILSPAGQVLVRHPGSFTAEQLDYVIHTLDPTLKGN